MNPSSNRLKAAIALNAVVVLLEAWAMANGLSRRGLEGLIFYTTLSNLYGCIACLACLVAEIRELRGGSPAPRAACIMKYSASCCLLMTLCVVLFVLAPMYNAAGYNGYYLMLCERELPITHLLGPVLVLVSYVFFEASRVSPLTFRQSFLGLLPTLAYAAVAYPCNIARLWEGPYPFFLVRTMPVWQSVAWFFALCVMAGCLCQVPRLIGNVLGRPPKESESGKSPSS